MIFRYLFGSAVVAFAGLVTQPLFAGEPRRRRALHQPRLLVLSGCRSPDG